MKSILKKGLLLVLPAVYLLSAACGTTESKEEPPATLPVSSVSIGNYTVKLSADASPEAGDNMFYWQLENAGKTEEIDEITIRPMMDMGTMVHSSPYEAPQPFEGSKSIYNSRVVFTMAGSWDLEFSITAAGGEVLEGSVSVEAAASWRQTSVRSEAGVSYYITWLQPKTPRTGNNALQFLVHKGESMMSYPAYENAGIEIYPFMDMGGGGHSTQFVNPDTKGGGLYEGSVNYSMSGTWTTEVILTAGDETLPAVEFEYNVQAK